MAKVATDAANTGPADLGESDIADRPETQPVRTDVVIVASAQARGGFFRALSWCLALPLLTQLRSVVRWCLGWKHQASLTVDAQGIHTQERYTIWGKCFRTSERWIPAASIAAVTRAKTRTHWPMLLSATLFASAVLIALFLFGQALYSGERQVLILAAGVILAVAAIEYGINSLWWPRVRQRDYLMVRSHSRVITFRGDASALDTVFQKAIDFGIKTSANRAD